VLSIVTERPPVALRTDATQIVYTTASEPMVASYARLEAVPLAGGRPRTLYSYDSAVNQFAWTLRGGSVYLNDGHGNIVGVPTGGGAPSTVATLSRMTHFDADESWLYFGQRDNKAGTEKLFRLPLSGGAPDQLAELDFAWEYVVDYTPNTTVEVVVDGCSLYWLHQPTIPRNGGSNRDGVVYRVPKDGGDKTAVISGLTEPEMISLTHQAIWVLDRGNDPFDGKDDRFVGVGKDGSPRTPILFIDRGVSKLIVDFGRGGDALHYVLWGPPNDLNAISGWWTRSLEGPAEALPIAGLTAPQGLYTATVDRSCGHVYSAVESGILRQPLPQ
jgi:hypothetical protein